MPEQETENSSRAQDETEYGAELGIVNPPIDDMLKRTQSKYALVVYTAKRARQIDQYYVDLHNGSFYDNVGPLINVTSDDKSLTVAMREICEDKLDLEKPVS